MTGLAMALLLAWMRVCSLHYGVEPEFALAVARVESGVPGGPALRCGPLGRSGKYYGPFGLHRDFLRRWPIDNPFVNVEIGVKALRGQDKLRVLRRYNPTRLNRAYEQAVMRLYRQEKARRQTNETGDMRVFSSKRH
jgi:hypothetical protein